MGILYRRLSEYRTSDYYGFHMPGHKRNSISPDSEIPYGLDITEIEGFDDLHHPAGILKKAQERAAEVYGAEETRFLINGSTAGILSAVLGSTRKGDTVLVARNCHKSVYHAISMNELKPVYLYPEFRGDIHLNTEISVSAVEAALKEHSDIRAVILVSPTYDGVISDIRRIAEIVHEKKIPLIVDEAHGAHLGFHPYFDENALKKGADLVIHSVHKTLPSLTQTALLHVQGEFADRSRVFRYLDMLQSSSPSYILMASIDECVELLRTRKEAWFHPYVERLQRLREELVALKHLKLMETERYDRSKLVISAAETGMSGRELYEILLREYHLQMEMSAGSYVLAMTSVCDSEEGFARLKQALFEIDERISTAAEADWWRLEGRLPENRQVMTCAQAFDDRDDGKVCMLPWKEAAGAVSAEYAYLYPPGIPLIVPGERVAQEAAALLEAYSQAGYAVEGMEREGYLWVLSEKHPEG